VAYENNGRIDAVVQTTEGRRLWRWDGGSNHEDIPLTDLSISSLPAARCPIRVSIAKDRTSVIVSDPEGELIERLDAKGLVGGAVLSPDCKTVVASAAHGDPEFRRDQAFSLVRWRLTPNDLTQEAQQWLEKAPKSAP
jgi:hypothetical protein